MTHNNSPHFGRSRRERGQPEPIGHSGPSEPYAELFAALDRADVSEAVRAALAHALSPPSPTGPPDEADPPADRHRPERGGGSLRLRSIGGSGEARRRYTLHLTFPAHDLLAARGKAAAYAEALLLLRPELTTGRALLSRADQWNHNEPVTCGRAGPDGEICVRAADHPGCHWDSILGGSCWSGGEPTGDRPGDVAYCDPQEDR